MESIEPAVQVSGLSFSYNGHPVLHENNLDIASSKLTFILGKNGSGKSTFLRILAGLLPFSEGKVKISGLDMRRCSAHERAKTIGFLNQHHHPVFPFLVEEVVLTGRANYIRYIPGKKDMQEVEVAMEKAGILHLRTRRYSELSGGEQQLVMIARVLAQNPRILLLDEPTTHLDFCNQSHLLDLLKTLTRQGLTVVAVLHDPNLAFLYGDDFLFASEGKIIRTDKTGNAWDLEFLKNIYHEKIKTIPYNGRAFLIPEIN